MCVHQPLWRCTTLQTMRNHYCWHLQGNRHSRVSERWCKMEFARPQYLGPPVDRLDLGIHIFHGPTISAGHRWQGSPLRPILAPPQGRSPAPWPLERRRPRPAAARTGDRTPEGRRGGEGRREGGREVGLGLVHLDCWVWRSLVWFVLIWFVWFVGFGLV